VTVQSDEQESNDLNLSEDEDEEGRNDHCDLGDEVGAIKDSKSMSKATFFFNTGTIISYPGSQEGNKTQKALLAQHRASKPHAGLTSEAKRVWSLARQKNIPTKERQLGNSWLI